jgi:hypothetical protein
MGMSVWALVEWPGQEAEVLGCPEPQARASVIVDSQRHPRLPLSGGACGGRSDRPPLQDHTKKIGGPDGAQEIERWNTLERFLGGKCPNFRLNGVGRAGEGEGNCGNVPTEKHCPSWVVANFKARSCNPHTRRRLRFLFHHDSVVANDYLTSTTLLLTIFLPTTGPPHIILD